MSANIQEAQNIMELLKKTGTMLVARIYVSDLADAAEDLANGSLTTDIQASLEVLSNDGSDYTEDLPEKLEHMDEETGFVHVNKALFGLIRAAVEEENRCPIENVHDAVEFVMSLPKDSLLMRDDGAFIVAASSPQRPNSNPEQPELFDMQDKQPEKPYYPLTTWGGILPH